MALKPKVPLKDTTFAVFKKAVEASCKETRQLSRLWAKNIERTFGEVPKDWDDALIRVNKDYPRARQLQSQLFFRVPEVQAKPRVPGTEMIAPVVAAAINQKLREMGVSYAIDEVLTDAIVPSGVGVAFIDYEAITQTVEVKPAEHLETPDEVFAGLVESGAAAYQKASVPTYEAYVFRRVDPKHFLWPVDFDGSNWDDAPWLGERFSMPVGDAKRQFKLSSEEVKKLRGGKSDRIDGEEAPEDTYEKVWGYRIFYRRCFYDDTATHKDQLRRLVYFDGLDKPVVHEDYHAQRLVNGQIVGVRRYPIRPMTRVFVPGKPIPPSDVTVARPQVLELEKGRNLQMLQRERSLPIRWMDVNQVDEETESLLMEGRVQSFIPFNGPATNAIGEIARANYPRENFEHDRVIERDLSEVWAIGPAQMGQPTPGETTAEEVRETTSAANTRLDYDRAKVLRWFIECCEVLFGLMQLYADQTDFAEMVGPEGATQLVAWNKEHLKGWYALEARPDAALRLDAAADRQQALNLFSLLGNDPFIDRRSLLQEVLRTHNLVDSKILLPQPPEPKPEKPNIAFRFSGEDLDPTRPSALAVYEILKQSGMQIPDEIIQQAKEQAVRTRTLAAQNPMLGLADTLRADYRGNAPALPGAPQQQPENPGAVTPVPKLNKTVAEEGRTNKG